MKTTPVQKHMLSRSATAGFLAMEVAGAWAWRIVIAGASWILEGSGARLPAGYFSSGGFASGGSVEPRRDASA